MHIKGLDGLRGLAALAVFSVHFNQTVRFDSHLGPFNVAQFLENGEYGVSLFFSLSGFLLSIPFWQALTAGSELPNLKSYALRRVARIMPAYYVALTLLIILSGMWHFPSAFSDILLHYAFLFNFAEFSIFSINAPFWSLAVEMQFYILLPLLFMFVARMKGYSPLLFIILIAVCAYLAHYSLISNVTRIIEWPLDHRLIWVRPFGAVLSHSLLAHLPHFLLGVIAGYIFLYINTAVREHSLKFERVSEFVFWCALVTILILLSTPFQDLIQLPYARYGFPLVTLLLTAMIVCTPRTRLARRCLDGFPLRTLGSISYGIYIYHLPCLLMVDRYMAAYAWDAVEHWIVFGLLSLSLTIVIAMASFALVEKPAVKLVRKWT